MGFLDHANRAWAALSPAERETLLSALASATPGYRADTWWGGMPIGALRDGGDYDSLPADLQGRLLIALTDGGFSVEESQRVQSLLDAYFERST